MKRILLLSLSALLAMVPSARGESALRWDAKTQEVRPNSQEKTARADFGFTNASSQPVTIESVRSSCGCTTAALEKKTYQPGEKGRIVAIFTIGSRQGTQVKAIRVGVRGESEPTLLTMVTHVGEAVKIDPPLVYWRTGDAPRPKTIKLKFPDGLGLRVARVSSSDAKIAAAVETLKEGAEYKITVTPEGTARECAAVLTIQAVSRANESKTFLAYAQVKGAGGAGR